MIQINIPKLKEDQRKLEDATAYRRSLAVLLFCTKGDMSLSGFTLDHAKRLKGQYLKMGIDAFLDKRHSNRDRVLTRKERNKVITDVSSKKPRELIAGCHDDYWTTHWLGEYIRTLTGKRYKSKTSSYLIFKEAKLTWHKPGKVYDKADPLKQELWKKETQPILQAHWNNPNTVIFCVDEMVLSIKSTIQKVWLPKGTYPPVIETTGTRKNKSGSTLDNFENSITIGFLNK